MGVSLENLDTLKMQQDLVMEQMVGMILGPAAIFSLGSLIVGLLAIIYAGASVTGSQDNTALLLREVQSIHQQLQVANDNIIQGFYSTENMLFQESCYKMLYSNTEEIMVAYGYLRDYSEAIVNKMERLVVERYLEQFVSFCGEMRCDLAVREVLKSLSGQSQTCNILQMLYTTGQIQNSFTTIGNKQQII